MKHRASSELGIMRSRLGWLSVRFDGGPFYPEMLDSLQQAVIDFGGLVRRGESLTAAEWLQRIDAIGGGITPAQILAIQTLMWPRLSSK
ncbi:hypothetical protein [Pseudomonas sp. zfem002]|uniref:hypothetical protein n=1 Tax=Pseudomonas sp. zfem002 TaxID=3078197 RepID=UPI00292871C3|nr:hypothetical protein [Pseudomonas sp. zfem002]MDU9390504.1 hypothetical protein [Pseudomonas sp. zfem002]